MSVGGLVIFALGLICGVGIAIYFARSSGESSEGAGEAGTRDSPESASSRAATAQSASTESSSDEASVAAGGASVDVEELMGREEAGGGSGVTDTSDVGSLADGGMSMDEASAGESARPSAGETADETVHWLEGISGSVAGKTYEIEEALTVGRLPRNDLQLNEGDVSRVHCRFRPEGDEVVLEALDTPNGTRINDRELGPGDPVALTNEDVVEVGKVLLMYHSSAAAELPEGLGEESSEVGLSMGADAATVTVDTTGWRDRIVEELEAAGGDVSVAAQALGMDPEALERLAEQLEISD